MKRSDQDTEMDAKNSECEYDSDITRDSAVGDITLAQWHVIVMTPTNLPNHQLKC